jgi:uncharacterized protein YigA (DUF484 family)
MLQKICQKKGRDHFKKEKLRLQRDMDELYYTFKVAWNEKLNSESKLQKLLDELKEQNATIIRLQVHFDLDRNRFQFNNALCGRLFLLHVRTLQRSETAN